LDESARNRVAHHETGHALVAAYSEHADPVHKISIIPRGRAALGYTLQLPTEDQFLMTRSELIDRLKGWLGGRAAEEIVFKEISTGAENDLEKATALARQMVCMFGMSDKIGLVHCARRENPFMPDGTGLQNDCSQQTAEQIDTEVKALLDQSYADAKEILTTHRDKLDLVAKRLLEQETIDGDQFQQLLGRATAVADAT
jgi:cell division protease FtsH